MGPETIEPETVEPERDETARMPQTGMTVSVPDEYLEPADHQGQIVRMEYDTKNYAGDSSAITKPAYVYLPYGYDENDADIRYDILYLMHGWTMTAGDYFEGSYLPEILDHMIENGEIPPLLVVSATFDAENEPQDFSLSVRELREFHQDLRNDLIPAVESRFHTYAETTDSEGLAASRDHRAFGGFSLGAVTTWHQFVFNHDYIRYFLPMSGSCWYYGGYGDYYPEETCDLFEEFIESDGLEEKGYFIYGATGTSDAIQGQMDTQMVEMLARSDVFTPDRVVYYKKQGGVHDLVAVQEYVYNALPFFFGGTPEQQRQDVTADTTVSEVETIPAFGDYGRLLFPVDRPVEGSMTLDDLSVNGIYVWYNNIRTEKTVEIINYLKEQAESGKQVFYNIYTEEQRKSDPSKQDTGLFFFRGEPGAEFAVTNAGGGMMYVGAMHDSFPHALEVSRQGYNAFALIYRPDHAYEDLAQAIEFIYDNADELEVSPDGYSLWGGSAGARMAATLGNSDYLQQLTGRTDIPQAAAVIMQYTGHSDVSEKDAPTYACVGTSDGIASWRTMERRLQTLEGYGIPTEFHSYEGLPHGFGLGTGTVAEGWLDDAVAFWEKQMEE
ncbi:MAG: esterase [Blautia sp.]|nr:esterase [Blautia sp.]